MNHISFNQDYTCFAYSAKTGFVVYNCDPPSERFIRPSIDGITQIRIIEMLYRSNIFAIVGEESPTKMLIWDDFKTKCIAELEFDSQITGIRLRRDIILVILEDCVRIYGFADLKEKSTHKTYSSSRGIAAVTAGTDTVVAFPSEESGMLHIENFVNGESKNIKAHTNPLSCIALSTEGERVATASIRGTLIRIFNTDCGELIHEFRRGIDVAIISSMIFDLAGDRLAVCSNKGTLHIFGLETEKVPPKNRHSRLTYISNYLPQYFSSKWSAVSLQVPANGKCAFGVGTSLIIVAKDGDCCKYEYDPETLTGKKIDCLKLTGL